MAKFIPVEVFDLVIFGGAGDLALRKLMPALYHRDADGQLPSGCRIISVGRRAMSRETFLSTVHESLRVSLADSDYSTEHLKTFASRIEYIQADALDHSSWQDLIAALDGYDDRTRVVYMATVPSLFGAGSGKMG